MPHLPTFTRRRPAALLAAACALGLSACQPTTQRMSTDQLREAMLATHRAQLEGRAREVQVQREPSEFERSLQRVLDKAREDGVRLPDDRQTVSDNLQAADAMSGADAYRDTPVGVGGDLLNVVDAPTVRLDLATAVRKAVEHNLDLAVARLSPQISEQQIIQAESVFDTVLFAGGDWTQLDTPRPPGAIPGLSGDQQAETRQLRTGIRQAFDTGGELVVQASVERSQSSPSFFGVSRFYDSDVLVQLTQPLLRGYGSDVNRANIEIASIARRADLVTLRQTMIDLAVAVEQAYWQLVSARQSLKIQERLLDRTIAMRDKLEPRFGFDLLLADLNEVNARVDQRRADVIRSRETVRSLSDRLKRLINDPELPLIDETLVVPADSPADAAVSFSLLDEVTAALRHRPEIDTALLQINDIDVRRVVADNAQLPILNLTAAATFNGLDVNDPGDALGNTADLDFIDYALGVEFEQPWGNREGEALFRQRTLERQQALENYRRQAQVVTLEVKDAMRSVDTNYRLTATFRSQRRASALSLEVADVQLERGGRNEAETFTTRVDRVLARQDALAQAELAEVQALTDYMIAISELHRATGTTLEQAGVEFEAGDDD